MIYESIIYTIGVTFHHLIRTEKPLHEQQILPQKRMVQILECK